MCEFVSLVFEGFPVVLSRGRVCVCSPLNFRIRANTIRMSVLEFIIVINESQLISRSRRVPEHQWSLKDPKLQNRWSFLIASNLSLATYSILPSAKLPYFTRSLVSVGILVVT